MKVHRFTSENTRLLSKARMIRTKVFVDEQGVGAELEFEYDEEAHHYLLCEKSRCIAAARWREVNGSIKLERFAVLPKYRSRGYGKIILLEVLIDVLPLMKPVFLHSQVRAVKFYERNGFVKEGEMFPEAGIEHFKMVYPR